MRAASAAKRIISTAPTAKFGATKSCDPAPARAAEVVQLRRSRPDVPTMLGTPCSRQARMLPTATSGRVKWTVASSLGPRPRRRSRSPDLVSGLLERGRQTSPPSPGVRGGRPSRRGSGEQLGLDPPHRVAEPLLARADPGSRELLGREQDAGELGHGIGRTASISAAIRSIESSSVSVISDFPSRLIRFDVDSIESRMRPFRFSFARSSSPLRNSLRRPR